jgi:hypothetical protein
MPVTASAEAAQVNRRRGSAADGVTFWHTLYIGTSRYNMAPDAAEPARETLFPMGFLVEQDPGSTASSHWHQQDQFQVVVGGQGTLGTHEIQPVTVHFTGAYTAYGPIRASATEGVHYFTLRNGYDPGARFMTMPENRAALRTIAHRRHREAVAGPLALEPSGLGSGRMEVLPEQPDGMGAWRYRLAPHARAVGPDPATGRGQYWVVVGGGMVLDGQTLGPRSCSFVYPGEAAVTAVAGPDGLDVLALQFPRHDGP